MVPTALRWILEVNCIHQLLGLGVLQLQVALQLALPAVLLVVRQRPLKHGRRPRPHGLSARAQLLVLISIHKPAINFPGALRSTGVGISLVGASQALHLPLSLSLEILAQLVQ